MQLRYPAIGSMHGPKILGYEQERASDGVELEQSARLILAGRFVTCRALSRSVALKAGNGIACSPVQFGALPCR